MNQIMQQIDEEDLEEEIPKKIKNLNYNKRNKPKKSVFEKILIILAILIIIGGSSLGILLYGPYNGFRDWLITTAMTTMMKTQ